MATCLDVAGGAYPESYNGNQITPLEGISLVPVFEKNGLEREAIYWEHEGNRAVRMGKWKLVSRASQQHPFIWDKVNTMEISNWELFDMEQDRTEMFNLAPTHPKIVKKMSDMWLAWGQRTGIIPRPEK
jgi:arylsulfatase